MGRLSAGSKITSLLSANDIVFCGTEAGVIKVKITPQSYKFLNGFEMVRFLTPANFLRLKQGWIPL